MLKNILVFLVVVLIGAGSGTMHAYLQQTSQPGTANSAPEKVAVAAPGVKSETSVRLAPIVANLALPEGMWIRIDVILVTTDKARKDVETLSANVAQDFLAYLQTLSISDLEGSHSLSFLRQEFIERARIRSENKVKDVLLNAMVIQ
jgi:flagellar FliL protein